MGYKESEVVHSSKMTDMIFYNLEREIRLKAHTISMQILIHKHEHIYEYVANIQRTLRSKHILCYMHSVSLPMRMLGTTNKENQRRI